MGQYYKPYLLEEDSGLERTFNPQNAVFRTVHGIEGELAFNDPRCKWDMGCETSYGYLFSGMKLMEHSWLGNDFVNGVLESIWENPCRVAWVGDYACEPADFDGIYTNEIYDRLWSERELPEGRFDAIPKAHEDGYIVNVTKGVYIDLAKHARAATYSPGWDKGQKWCVHPLPLLTCIGNGRGGGDYRGTCMDMVGAWAMDELEYTVGKPEGLQEIDYSTIIFKEV